MTATGEEGPTGRLPVPLEACSLSRRRFLQLIGGGTLVGLTPTSRRDTSSVEMSPSRARGRPLVAAANAVREHTRALPAVQRVWRSEDLMLVHLQYLNLELDTSASPPVLVAKDASSPAYLVVTFPPQHVLEQALPSTSVSGGTTDQSAPPDALLSGTSRLVFQLQESGGVPFTFDTVFSWFSDAFTPSLSPLADQPPAPGPYPAPPSSAPAHDETAIEAPWQLTMTPDSSGGWAHSLEPVTRGSWTELWHTRLGVVTSIGGATQVVEPPRRRPNVRAVWTPGYGINLQPPADPFSPTPLTNQDRFDLVHNMTTYLTGGPPNGYIATPAKADLFHLSAFGASMSVVGDWPGAATTTGLTSWLQRSAAGRDSYVRVEQAGYLFPTGHKASLVTVSDRQFVANSAASEVEAYLVETSYVVVRGPTKDYAADPFDQGNITRALPFRQMTLTTLVTPPVNTTSGPPLLGLAYPPAEITDAFWITDAATGDDISFNVSAVDWAGTSIDFQMPLAFISAATGSSVDAYDTSAGGAPASIIEGFATDPRAVVDLGGQQLTYVAPTTGNTNTTHPTGLFTFGAVLPNATVSEQQLVADDQPAWYPQWSTSEVVLRGLSQLAGVTAASGPDSGRATGGPGTRPRQAGDVPTSISPNADYVTNNYSPSNAAEVFADIETALSAVFGGTSATGVATPNFSPTGLSRQLGPLADAANLVKGIFDPLSYFSDDASLLGGITLGEIIQSVQEDDVASSRSSGNLLSSVPNLSLETIDDPVTMLPTAFLVSYTLQPSLQSDTQGLFNPHDDASLVIEASVTIPVANPSSATAGVTASLCEFDVDLFGSDPSDQFFVIDVEKVTFTAGTGKKAAVNVSIGGVSFGQALSFVDILQQFLSSDDGDGGPAIDVEPSGATLSYSLPIPDATLGAISVFNMSLSAELDVPFNGAPVTVSFAFCSQEQPFQLAIGMFGGGGFFAISLTVAGVQSLQVSLEVGLVASLDLGVASGSASLEAGLSFSLTVAGDGSQSVTLTGFIRADGKLTFLGIVAISVHLYLGLTYLDPGKAYGEASITVNVSIAFFSTSVTATCRRTLGGGSDPTFAELMSRSDWANYARAFAA